jgi:hypothetical protein
MPYKSDKQRRYMHAAAERGDISESVVDEFDKASKGKKLPESAPSAKGKAASVKRWASS